MEFLLKALTDAISNLAITIQNTSRCNLLTVLPIVLSAIALLFSLHTKYSEKKLLRKKKFESLMMEYRSPEMYTHVKRLYDSYRTTLKKLESKGLGPIEQKRYVFKQMIEKTELNISRRYVSQFFATFATYYLKKEIDRNEVKSFWVPDNLEIIKEILIPLDKTHIKNTFEQNDATINQNVTLRNLQSFYDAVVQGKR